MMKIIRAAAAALLACSLLPAAPARAQGGKSLLGYVVTDYPPDVPDWSVQVAAQARGTGRLPRSPFSSTGTIYLYQIDPNALVSFIFSRTYYRSTRSPWVTVTPDLSNPFRVAPDVTLHRIRRRREISSARPPSDGDAPPFRTASYSAQQGAQPARPAAGPEEAKEREVAGLRKELEEQAELARASGTADIFQFNLEVYEDVYRGSGDAALKEEVTRFKGDPAYKDVAAAPAERAELYDKIVRRDRGEAVAIDPNQLIGVAGDPSASPSVRQSAVRAMGADAVPAARYLLLNFLRDNSKPTSDLRLTSLIQLIRIGTPEDRLNILKALDTEDAFGMHAIITAIEATGWREGKEALGRISSLETVSPSVREAAASALDRLGRPLAPASPDAFLWWARARDYARSVEKVRREDSGREWMVEGSQYLSVPASQWVTLFGTLREARAYLDVKKGARDVALTLRLQGPTNLSGGERIVLWALTPDGKSVRLGQTAVTTPNAQSLPVQIEGQVALERFGLLLMVEKGGATAVPSGERVAVIPQ